MRASLFACLAFALACSRSGQPAATLAIVNATVYATPDGEPVPHGTVLIAGDVIMAVGRDLVVPANARVIDARGGAVTAGFWNSHVHFTDPRFDVSKDDAALTQAATEMLVRYGVTTAVDLGSDPRNTVKLRDRLAAPHILTAGPTIWMAGGIPFYMPPDMETPVARDDAEAVAIAKLGFDHGTDMVKIFSGSPTRDGVKVMPLSMVRAVTSYAHAQRKPVAAHPQSLDGVKVAIEGGVDILAHTAPKAEQLPDEVVTAMVAKHVSITPTLTLWHQGLIQEGETEADALAHQAKGVRQLAQLVAAKVDILFGTDVGYMHYSDTREELRAMGEAGMTFSEVLAALTTRPAKRFADQHRGAIAAGKAADLVILERDPAGDVTALADVRATIVGGKLVYEAP